jgi:hypothetical protein
VSLPVPAPARRSTAVALRPAPLTAHHRAEERLPLARADHGWGARRHRRASRPAGRLGPSNPTLTTFWIAANVPPRRRPSQANAPLRWYPWWDCLAAAFQPFDFTRFLADGVGFEPTVGVNPRRFSRANTPPETMFTASAVELRSPARASEQALGFQADPLAAGCPARHGPATR